MKMRSYVGAVVVASVLALTGLHGAAQSRSYDSFFVFGDSLVDTGNDWTVTKAFRFNPAIPPSTSPHRTYFQGHFSNGPNMVEYLWKLLNPSSTTGVKPITTDLVVPRSGAVDFAFGGSGTGDLTAVTDTLTVPGLKGQVELFRLALLGRRPSAGALYLVFSGANDYIVQPPDPPANPVDVVKNIQTSIQRLYSLGARNIMVVNLPDLGRVPLITDPQAKAGLTYLTIVHNTLLSGMLDVLSASLPGVNIIRADAFTEFYVISQGLETTIPAIDTIVPPLLGQPPFSTCLFLNPLACPDIPTQFLGPNANVGPFFFWDVEHPTTDVHRSMGDYLFSKLQ
jgi:phospholipase/lecithinase/hemolysin